MAARDSFKKKKKNTYTKQLSVCLSVIDNRVIRGGTENQKQSFKKIIIIKKQ